MLTAQDVVRGSMTAGYRFTDVSGRREKYNELFDLRRGFRIQDFSLYSPEGQKTRLYDSFFLTTSGIGGEPFSAGQFNLKKNHVYDLRVNYQQSYFYWNRNDDQPQPTGLHGLTTNHDWSTVRKIGSINLAAYATSKLRLNFEYQQTGRTGSTTTPRFNIHTDYRYFRYNIRSDAEFQSSTNGAAPANGNARTEWRQGMHSLDVALEFTPVRQLQLKPGIRLRKRDVTVLDDSVAKPQATKRSKIASPILTAYYAPSRRLMLRGDIQSTTNGTPYTRISPRKDFNVRWVARYEPSDRISIENNLHVRNSEYSTTDYRNALRSNSTNITYQLNDRLSLLGGFTYDSFLATASITFLRGVAPLSATWQDQTVNRVWQAGVEAKPARRLTLNLSGNYIRTTGVGEISGEPPTAGPVRWPFATGTASYDFPRVGRLSVDLQRTYYIEEILRGDNFSANLLNIRWTTEF